MPRVQALGMPAVAMTDHGNMFGAIEFYKTAAARRRQADHRLRGLRRPGQPPREAARRAATTTRPAGNYHLILLAMNKEGYRNLCRLVTARLHGGLLLQAAHRQGAAARAQRGPDRALRLPGERGQPARSPPARSTAPARVLEEYRALFDGRYYLEIQDNHLAEQDARQRELWSAWPASSACRWSPPTTATTWSRTTRRRTTSCSASRPARR